MTNYKDRFCTVEGKVEHRQYIVRLHSHRYECEFKYTVPIKNTSCKKHKLHVFQWWPFTLIRVLYKYVLPVNFTHTSTFCTGPIQSNILSYPILKKWTARNLDQFNLYRPWRIFDVIYYVILKLVIIRGARLAKIINVILKYCYFFAKHSLDSISLEIVNRHALSYVLVQVTASAPLVRVKLVRVTDNP